MPKVKKLDSKRRALFPDRFAPGDVFVEDISENEVTYRLVVPAVPEGKVERRNGRLMLAQADAPDREAIAKALREERDSR